MSTRIHPQARTTPKIRQEIKDSRLSDRQAAKVFNITRATAAKWINRDDVQDRSHRAHTLHSVAAPPRTSNNALRAMRDMVALINNELFIGSSIYELNPKSWTPTFGVFS